MSEKDFDVDQLAAYLHLMPRQVERLANRGELPGRKVGGQWRFSHAEIHHWMEARMGLLGDEELAEMESKLSPSGVVPKLAELVRPEAIAMPLDARTRNRAIEAMVQLAVNTGLLWDPDAMADAVRAREELQSTAMDNGVALLHPRRPLPAILAEPLVAVGRVPQGIPFGGSRRLTDIFFLICSVDDRGHLRSLARLSRLLGDEAFLESLRAANTPQELRDVIVAYEQSLEE
jgi:PTS system nitrogen regulatory IIA component